jgi:hypothetical protein
MSTGLAQGDLRLLDRLLDSEVAQRLLSSTIPARLAYIATDGTPRVIATWFSWTGEELVMSMFLAAPHEHRQPPGSARCVPIPTWPSPSTRITFPRWCSPCGDACR